jgi:hypothetical protein
MGHLREAPQYTRVTQAIDALKTALPDESEPVNWRERYDELASAVDGYATCRGGEEERMKARCQIWIARNRHKTSPEPRRHQSSGLLCGVLKAQDCLECAPSDPIIDEREHCENVAAKLDDNVNSVIYNYSRTTDIILSERATRFAAGSLAGFERGRAVGRELEEHAFAANQRLHLELEALQSEYGILEAAARAVIKTWKKPYGGYQSKLIAAVDASTKAAV